ncbi:ssDNA-binding protein, mitochondrial [Pseudocyphellaria aurata]|nr:ssDNA-binding protein, mitochondrial [Pseudocyphellaria aurata]
MSFCRSLFRVQRSLPIARAFSQTASNNAAKITIVGRLGAPPQLVPSTEGKGIPELIRYALATSYGPKRSKTSWFNVGCYSGNNEGLRNAMLNLPKGALVYVEGDAIMHKYEEASGNEITQLRIVQRNIEFLERRPTEGEHGEHGEGASEESPDSPRT